MVPYIYRSFVWEMYGRGRYLRLFLLNLLFLFNSRVWMRRLWWRPGPGGRPTRPWSANRSRRFSPDDHWTLLFGPLGPGGEVRFFACVGIATARSSQLAARARGWRWAARRCEDDMPRLSMRCHGRPIGSAGFPGLFILKYNILVGQLDNISSTKG
eukprot:SAG31_NODE_146_length_22601_cov_56.529192_17_plen_156_part_00